MADPIYARTSWLLFNKEKKNNFILIQLFLTTFLSESVPLPLKCYLRWPNKFDDNNMASVVANYYDVKIYCNWNNRLNN